MTNPEENFTIEEIYDALQSGADDDCPECGGEGCIPGECADDTCCCANPDTEPLLYYAHH